MDPKQVERDGGAYELVHAAGHCHAPACISIELWDDDRGELLCRGEPVQHGEDGSDTVSASLSGLPFENTDLLLQYRS